MNDRRRAVARLLGGFAAATLATLGQAGAAHAQSQVTSPVVAIDHYEMKPGDTVNVFVKGFGANSVTIAVCGNEARRGSGDCAMAASLASDLVNGESSVPFKVTAPPVPCPCLVRAASANNDEVAVAPITLVGHPSGPVIESSAASKASLTASILAEPSPGGMLDSLKSGLGGATSYEITVTVKNTSAQPINNIRADGAVGRNQRDEITTLLLSAPDTLAPGETWRQTVRAKLPAPSFGKVQWRVAVSSDAPTVTAIDETTHSPVLLYIVLGILIVDVLTLAWRFYARRGRAQLEREAAESVSDQDSAPKQLIGAS